MDELLDPKVQMARDFLRARNEFDLALESRQLESIKQIGGVLKHPKVEWKGSLLARAIDAAWVGLFAVAGRMMERSADRSIAARSKDAYVASATELNDKETALTEARLSLADAIGLPTGSSLETLSFEARALIRDDAARAQQISQEATLVMGQAALGTTPETPADGGIDSPGR